MTLFYPLEAPRELAAGTAVAIEAVRRATSIQLWVADTTD